MACDMAYDINTLGGMGSVLASASSPESVKDEDNGKAKMARMSSQLNFTSGRI